MMVATWMAKSLHSMASSSSTSTVSPRSGLSRNHSHTCLCDSAQAMAPGVSLAQNVCLLRHSVGTLACSFISAMASAEACGGVTRCDQA